MQTEYQMPGSTPFTVIDSLNERSPLGKGPATVRIKHLSFHSDACLAFRIRATRPEQILLVSYWTLTAAF
jgi:hypothetical protein